MTQVFAWLQNPINFFWWLSHPLSWWVRAKIVPAQPMEDLPLNRDRPVLYVLPHRSLTDLLLLYSYCRKLNLPLPRVKPKFLTEAGTASFVYLTKLGLLQPIKSGSPPPPLLKMCRRASEQPGLQVDIVPVSIIWGRNPAKKERSLFKLLFADDENAGLLQKFFITLAQGRDVVANFGKPISLREQVDKNPDNVQVARMLRRVLRVHFQKQRTVTLGPSKYNRNRVIHSLLKSKPIVKSIQLEVEKTSASFKKVEAKARVYLREVASQQSHATIRFCDRLLNYVWNRIYKGIDVSRGEGLRKLTEDYNMVYVPSHRSHLDYLILPYELFQRGLTVPHTAAGVNLNFWPMGGFLRRGGAFFIRRSFRGNRLYATVFSEYLKFLINRGQSVTFFPEGGRSRTGRLLAPKTGMLNMIVQSYIEDPTRPLALMPVYFGYDKVFEVGSYLKELRGSKKKKESFGQFLSASKILRSNLGKAHVGFGEPLFLDEELRQRVLQWSGLPNKAGEKPEWLPKFVAEIAAEIMCRINGAAVVSPVALVSLVVLSAPQRAVAEEELVSMLDLFRRVLKASSFCPGVKLPDAPSSAVLADAEKVSPLSRFKYLGGDVIYVNELDGVILSYYKNNIMHLFALPSLIASYFEHNDSLAKDELFASCREIYPFLKREFFLKWSTEEVDAELERLVQGFLDAKLLVTADAGRLTRASVASTEFASLKVLGRVLGSVFQRYAISAAVLMSARAKGRINRGAFEAECQQLGQRLSILNGINDPEFYDKSLYRNYVDMLRSFGYLQDVENGELGLSPSLEGFAKKSLGLLSADMVQSLHKFHDQGDG